MPTSVQILIAASPEEIAAVAPDSRSLMMAMHLHSNKTLQQVADIFGGLSRERVRQIVNPLAEALPQVELKCEINGCPCVAQTRPRPDLCRHHARIWRTHGDPEWIAIPTPPPAERFWARVKRVKDGCWLWTSQVTANGYGIFHVGTENGNPVRMPAQRYSMEVLGKRPRPPGKWLLHKCHTKICVKYTGKDHLYYGTPADNARDTQDNGGRRPHLSDKERAYLVSEMSIRSVGLRPRSVELAKELGMSAASVVTTYYRCR